MLKAGCRQLAQDGHPTAEDWQALHDEIDRQHPQLLRQPFTINITH